MSFMMDLYQPLYMTRPTVTPALFAGLRPRVFDDGVVDSVAATQMMMKEEREDVSARTVG